MHRNHSILDGTGELRAIDKGERVQGWQSQGGAERHVHGGCFEEGNVIALYGHYKFNNDFFFNLLAFFVCSFIIFFIFRIK